MRTLRELLRLEENEPLDFSEIQTILGHRVRNLHVKFSDLESYKNKYTLADLLPPHPCQGTSPRNEGLPRGASPWPQMRPDRRS